MRASMYSLNETYRKAGNQKISRKRIFFTCNMGNPKSQDQLGS